MAFKPVVWYCRPVVNGIWSKGVDSAFGPYTACATDSLVMCISHLVLWGLCIYRIWLLKRSSRTRRFRLSSNYYNYMLGLLAACSTAEPILRLLLGISIFNLDGETSLAPYEMVSLIVEALAWCSMLIMIGLETKIYIHELRWFVRFGVVYVLIGDAVILYLILPMRDYYIRSSLYLYISMVFCQVLFGFLLIIYLPNLDPYPGYTALRAESIDDVEYEALPGEEHVCPERQAGIFSKIYFGWMTPLMQLGYKKPITEKDVWKLDT